MAKQTTTVRYSAKEIETKLARGEDQTDYAREVTDAEIAEQIAGDPDLVVPENWEEMAFRGVPAVGRETR